MIDQLLDMKLSSHWMFLVSINWILTVHILLYRIPSKSVIQIPSVSWTRSPNFSAVSVMDAHAYIQWNMLYRQKTDTKRYSRFDFYMEIRSIFALCENFIFKIWLEDAFRATVPLNPMLAALSSCSLFCWFCTLPNGNNQQACFV